MNGRFVGRKENTFLDIASCFDVSDKIKTGKNSIVVGIKAGRWLTHFGLHNSVKVVTHDLCLNKGWKIKEGIGGQNSGWFATGFDD